MSWMDAINDIVNRYAGAGSAGSAPAVSNPHQDYVNVAQAAPPEVMADALSHTFQSDQTPSFPEMVSSLFRQSNPNQQAGLLNQLLGALGPAALGSIPALRGLAGSLTGQGVTPEMASQVSPDQIQQMAQQAQRETPSIVNQVSSFYARHPDVVKALGGLAITVALQHIARRR